MRMNEKELEDFHKFFLKHLKCQVKKPINESKWLDVKVGYGSGIGINFDVTCPSCGKSKDITDYGCW